MKRVLSLVLVCCLLLSCAPAYAAETNDATPAELQEEVRSEERSIEIVAGNHGDAETGYQFDVTLSGEPTGRILAALYRLDGKMTAVHSYAASETVSVSFNTIP